MSYDYWNEENQKIKQARNNLIREDYTKELIDIYDRKLEIFEDILGDLAPQLSDDQYQGTTSWSYEEELEKLDSRQEILEVTVQERIEVEEHKQFLIDIGMTQEQYDIHLTEEKMRSRSTFARNKKKT